MGITPSQWIAWIGAALAAAFAMTTATFTAFETKAESRDKREAIEKRLDRIEQKVDLLVDRRR